MMEMEEVMSRYGTIRLILEDSFCFTGLARSTFVQYVVLLDPRQEKIKGEKKKKKKRQTGRPVFNDSAV